ncbi:MAG: ABC transporter permease [Oscillospiraceae bacterium]
MINFKRFINLRSILTILGISIGVFSIVIISNIGSVGKYSVNYEMNSMGIGGLCIRKSDDYGTIKMTKDDLSSIQNLSNVKAATPLMTGFSNIKIKNSIAQCVLWGIDSNTADIVSMKLLHGRLLNKSDISKKLNVCIVDEQFAKKLFNRSNIINKEISVCMDNRYVNLTVVGVVSSGGNIIQNIMGQIVPTFVYAPYTTISMNSSKKGFSQIVAKLKDDCNETEATSNILRTLSQNYNGKIIIENLNTQKKSLNSILNIVTMLLTAIGGISLIVSGLSIMTVMLVTVSERTREIGIKKSIGAKKKHILLEFLSEALILTFIGGIIGVSSGLLVSFIGFKFLNIPFMFNIKEIIFSVLFCILIGVLFGVYPAIKAANLKPVDALKFE